MVKPVVPILVPKVPDPFRKWHLNTKHMPKSAGFQYILHARCALTEYPEIQTVRQENATAIATFITECLVSRYRPCLELVTDNGMPYVAAVEQIHWKWPIIRHIRISAYNSQANGIVERAHLTLQESLFKVAAARLWKKHLDVVVMAERLSVRQSTGHSPFFLAHGIEPTLPMDVEDDTELGRAMKAVTSANEFMQARADGEPSRTQMLKQLAVDLQATRERAAKKAGKRRANQPVAEEFKPGQLVLKKNSSAAMRHDAKPEDRYFGPFVVIQRTAMANYRLAELSSGKIDPTNMGARRLMPYHSREDLTERAKQVLESHRTAEEAEDDPDMMSDGEAELE
jgi:hypothetical protein